MPELIPTEYRIVEQDTPARDYCRLIRATLQSDRELWRVLTPERDYVLNRDARFEYLPFPSEQTPNFLDRTVFESKDAALAAFERCKEQERLEQQLAE